MSNIFKDSIINTLISKNEMEIQALSKRIWDLRKETLEDAIKLVINKARDFPNYSISELTKEALSFIAMVEAL